MLAPVRPEVLGYASGLRRRATGSDYSALKLRRKASLVYGGKGGTQPTPYRGDLSYLLLLKLDN
jgi:hypothetical protein